MGRNGMDVGFGPADSWRRPREYATRLDTLGVLVDDVVESEHRIALAMVRRTQAIERARKYSVALATDLPSGRQPTASSIEMAGRAFISEIAAALRVPDRTAERLIRTGEMLVSQLPTTLVALGEGRLSFRHAQILVDQSYGLDPAAVRELETRMLPVAHRHTPSRFEQAVRKTRERLNPESMVDRQRNAVDERGIELAPQPDGMVFLGAHVPAVAGIAIDNRLTELARSRQCDGEPRTLTQLKTDIFVDLLLGSGAGEGADIASRYRDIRPTVLVTIPAMTLLKRGSEPGYVEGYGPIDAATARDIASHSKSLRRLITDPVTGIVLSFDRGRYRIPKDLRTWLRVRDGTCRFPGCNRRAGPCEIDHTRDWALNGPTNHDNLAHLCRKHHTLKGAGEWAVEQTGNGKLKWTSPAGIPYLTDPETIIDTHEATEPDDTPPF